MNIMLLVNKKFEYKGYKEGLDFRMNEKKTSQLVLISEDPTEGHERMVPSREYKLAPYHRIKEFCIEYMFKSNESSSNSEKKYGYLKEVIENYNPDYIISVSTSESTPNSQGGDSENHSVNGCVFFGNCFFARDCSDCDPESGSHLEVSNKLSEGKAIYSDFYNDLAIDSNRREIEEGMIKVSNMPAKELFVDANEKNTSLGVVNVVNYSKYNEADNKTYEQFKDPAPYNVIPICLETTHAVVKMAAGDIPVLFVSPITDRYLKFEEDVKGDQNKDCSYNAGVVVANLLDFIYNKLQ